jgi:hypothetical protein
LPSSSEFSLVADTAGGWHAGRADDTTAAIEVASTAGRAASVGSTDGELDVPAIAAAPGHSVVSIETEVTVREPPAALRWRCRTSASPSRSTPPGRSSTS